MDFVHMHRLKPASLVLSLLYSCNYRTLPNYLPQPHKINTQQNYENHYKPQSLAAMGASHSCRTCTNESAKSKRVVVVMKEDGEQIKFKQGTRVKDVLDEYPFHKIIRCCTDRTVLVDSIHLNANWLYFLLPEGLAVNDTTYQSLMRAAFSRELIVSQVGAPPGKYTINGQAIECNTGNMLGGDEMGEKNSNWKPTLLTIVEITSPSVHSDKQAT